MRHVRRRQHPVHIHLPRRDLTVELRMDAEFQIRFAVEDDRALFRPVQQHHFLQLGRSRCRLHFAGKLPGVIHDALAAGERGANRTHGGECAVELRNAAREAKQAFDLGRQRAIGRIDAEPHFEIAVVAGATSGDAKAERLAAGDEGAIAAERAKQRADVAVEGKLLQRKLRTGSRIAEHDTAVVDRQPRDAGRVGTGRG